MAKEHGLEQKLDEVIAGTPALPESGKHTLAAWLPNIALAAGILSLLSGWVMLNWALSGGSITGDCNAYTVAGCGNWHASRFSFWLWLSIILVAIQGLMFLAAYPGLRMRRRIGWALLYNSALLNVWYGFVSLLSSFNATGRFFGALAASAIAMYFLFQVRHWYVPKNPVVIPIDKDWRRP